MTEADILKKLVSFDCLGGASNLAIINWIKDHIEKAGVSTRLVYDSSKTKASLHCRIGPAVDGGIILSGHTDVVPVDGQDWSSSPFEVLEKEGRLYGRGTCDMKAFLACCLAFLDDFQIAGLKKPVYFAFSYDEEVGCLGAPELISDILDYYDEKPAFAIIGEPTNMEMVAGQKGICVMETTVNGSAGHSSRIKQEVSAIHEAASLICYLESLMETMASENEEDKRFDPPHSSIHVGTIKGGIATNVIADECRFSWDIRVLPNEDAYDVIKKFESFCRNRELLLHQRFPGFSIKNKALIKPVPGLNSFEEKALLDFLNQIWPFSNLGAVSYAAEAGQFAEAGIPSIICGPGSIEQAHRANEYVEIEQLKACTRMLKNLTSVLSQESVSGLT